METTTNTATTKNNSIQGTNTTVLNVGGRYFEVSLSLIKQAPHCDDTMLSRLVSKEWINNTNNGNPTQAIFIDRDGDIFAHVLNYLRYGSIELPNSIPISMFERELDFYGITIHESSIQQSTSVGTMQHIKQEIANAELHHDMLLIATSCHTKYMSGRTTTHIRSGDIDLKHNPYFYDKTETMEVLNDYLGQFYGLQASACKRLFESDLDFVLKVKELSGVTTSQASSSTTTSIRPPTRHGRHNIEGNDDGSITSTVSDLIGEALQITPPRVKRDRRGPVLSETDFLRALEQALMTP